MMDKELRELLDLHEQFLEPFLVKLQQFYDDNIHALSLETNELVNTDIPDTVVKNMDIMIKDHMFNEAKPRYKVWYLLLKIQETCLKAAYRRVDNDIQVTAKHKVKIEGKDINGLLKKLTPEELRQLFGG